MRSERGGPWTAVLGGGMARAWAWAWYLMEGLHARLVSEGRAVVGGATEQVCSVAYLLLNFEETDPSVHERLAQAARTLSSAWY